MFSLKERVVKTVKSMPFLLFLLIVVGCGAVTEAYWESKPATISDDTITLSWRMVSEEEVAGYCGGKESTKGCAIQGPKFCKIFFVKPKDFNDTTKLTILGHEVWHCMGATHE